MEYTQTGESTVETNPSTTLFVRVTGFIIAFFALMYVIAYVGSFLQEDPFQGHELKRTKGVITSATPGTSRYFFRTRTGYDYHYQFTVGNDTHTGQFFIRSNKHYQTGHEINVEYRADDPAINRWRVDSSGGNFVSMDVMSLVLAVIFGGLFFLGAFMFCTGRNLVKRW